MTQDKKQSPTHKKVRLVKVIVQPVMVIDDGNSLTEIEHPPMTIPAEEWSTYSNERFPRELIDFERQINAEPTARSSAKREV